ncbi:hypothetical protein RPB_3073 [Rhodopseudomonas palustris HaA2]|uniref:Uncharacterized protein n=1 Tax=Rhodopseudomonas palustris (strain HaA2) TaxID=316058 RepID=Q2IVI6_RHOP2|nr:hypothetical protein [Rhodopseudomonas palustris]ABD07774.1 hypothetical protein RPB_3073 [Rhodopseudomonas palustris HaA2]
MKTAAAVLGSLIAAVMMLSFAAVPAWSQYAERTVQKIGPFTIDSINENGRFDRCAATLKGKVGMLRIAQNLAQKYSVSVPPTPGLKGPIAMTISFDFTRKKSYPGTTNGIRSWAVIDMAGFQSALKIKNNILISTGLKSFAWPIGNTSMESVMNGLDSCVARASGNT